MGVDHIQGAGCGRQHHRTVEVQHAVRIGGVRRGKGDPAIVRVVNAQVDIAPRQRHDPAAIRRDQTGDGRFAGGAHCIAQRVFLPSRHFQALQERQFVRAQFLDIGQLRISRGGPVAGRRRCGAGGQQGRQDIALAAQQGRVQGLRLGAQGVERGRVLRRADIVRDQLHAIEDQPWLAARQQGADGAVRDDGGVVARLVHQHGQGLPAGPRLEHWRSQHAGAVFAIAVDGPGDGLRAGADEQLEQRRCVQPPFGQARDGLGVEAGLAGQEGGAEQGCGIDH